jgi:hypothetical protein
LLRASSFEESNIYIAQWQNTMEKSHGITQ